MNGNAEKENVGEKLKATGFIGRYIGLSIIIAMHMIMKISNTVVQNHPTYVVIVK